MRLKNSIYNIISNFGIYFVKTILIFIVRGVFIQKISQTYLGLNGLFTNIISVLSLAELGIGSAIGFSLYKPLSQKDDKNISTLMSFYKKCYFVIGIVIGIIGIAIMPILPNIVNQNIENMFIIYLLFLINTVSLYFISYKEILIMSDQKNYKLTKINLLFTVLTSICEIIILYLTSNFILYLLVQFVLGIIQRIFINIYITKNYPNVNFNSKNKMDNETKEQIVTNIKAMVYHKIGDCMVNSTDNIIISSLINVNVVGIYSNYILITTFLTTFANMIYNGILASLGNLIVTEKEERRYEVFKKTNFLGFTIFSFCSVILINTFNSIINILAGPEYVFNFTTVFLIVLNFCITGFRIPSANIKIAAGIFDIDKFTPLIQSLINIVCSVILAKIWGINGVLIGTFLSSILPSIQRPYIVYKYVLKKSIKGYAFEYIKYIVITVVLSVITLFINSKIIITYEYIDLIQKFVLSSIIYLLFFLLIFRKNNEFIYYKNLVLSALKKIRRGNNERKSINNNSSL